MQPEEKDTRDITTQNTTPDSPEYSVSSRRNPNRLGTSATAALGKVKSFSSTQASGIKAVNKRALKGLGIVAIVALLAGLGGGWFESRQLGDSSIFTGSLSDQKRVVTSEGQLISSIAKSVGPSVVSVNVTGTQTSTGFFGETQSQKVAAAGTGIVLTSNGLILTNRHVVAVDSGKVSVTLSDGTKFKDVDIVGKTSTRDSLDVAFLKINDLNGKKLTPAVLGDSTKVQVGDTVVAIGNALGQFQNTVTSGIISGYGRSVQASSSSDTTGDSSENLEDLFQTDAAINEGNSGGPLVNMNGQVIGLNTAIAGGAQNIGFSIPMNDIAGLIKQVMQTGKLARPFLGVHYVLLTDDYAYQYNLSVSRGAYIAPSDDGTPSIVANSPAEKAGLQEKDIITEVDGTKIDASHSLTALLGQHTPGDKVDLTIIRNGKTINLTATLGTAPGDATN